LPYLVGIDLGTSATKTVLLTARGGIAAAASVEYSPAVPRPGWAEEDADTWLDAACEGISRCLRDSGIRSTDVAGIGLSGLAPALVLTGDDGRALAPAQLWLDRRGAELARELSRGPLSGRIVETSGNPIDAFYGTVKLLWEKENRPDLYRSARHAFSAVNYVTSRLTVSPSMDTANASLFGIAFDIRMGAWDEDLLRDLGIRPNLFPPLLRPEQAAGSLTPEAAARTGLAEGTPVVAGAVDGTAVCLAAGAVSPGDAIITLGTSALLYVVHEEPSFSRRLIAIRHPSDEKPLFTTVGAMTCGGVLLRYLKDLLGKGYEDDAGFERLTGLAAGVPPGCDGLVALPYFEGERTPIWNPDARGVFSGLRLGHGPGHIARSIMEGVAFGLRHNLETAEEAGIPVREPITIAEGGAKNPLWRRIVADVLGRELRYVGNLAGAEVGAAILAGVGTGLFSRFPSSDERDTDCLIVEPDPDIGGLYQKQYCEFRDLSGTLTAVFSPLSPAM
jgi:xylulokinase